MNFLIAKSTFCDTLHVHLRSGSYDGASAASSDVELSESTASDLSLSLTQSEPEEELPDGEESDGDVSAVGSPDQISDGSRKTSPTMALQRCRTIVLDSC